MKARIQTSKIMLALAAGAGSALLPLGIFAEINNLIVYALILGAAVFNRLDSRARGYKFSLQAGPAQASIETQGFAPDQGEALDPPDAGASSPQ